MQFESRLWSKRVEWIPFIIPGFLYLMIVCIYPLVMSIRMGFYGENPITGQTVYVGLRHYIELLKEHLFWTIVKHNFFFAGVSVLGHFLIGLGFAILLNRKIKFISAWRGLQFIPWLFPAAIASCLFILIYQRQYGLINSILYRLNLSSLTREWLGDPNIALTAVTIVNIWNWYPFHTLMFLAAMQAIPTQTYEAMSIDGGGEWTKFWFITVPFLRPVMLTVCLLDFIWTFRFFDMIWIMTKGGPARTTEILPSYIYKTAFHLLDFNRAAAIGGLMCIFMCAFVVLYLFLYSSKGSAI